MLCKEVIQVIEASYPRDAALDFDNVGLLAGRLDKEVNHVYLALDATDAVISRAIDSGADMLITHHPLIFSPMKSVTDGDFIGRRVVRLIQNDISYYAMHTNYDVLGMAALSAEMLGLTDTAALEEVLDGEGIGRIGRLPRAMTLEECARLVKERFALPNVKIFGELNKIVTTAAISPGSGKSMARPALEAGVDVLISGDIDHHTGIDMADCGMAIIDAGHYGIEHIYIEDMRRFLEKEFADLKVYTAPVKQPFQVV